MCNVVTYIDGQTINRNNVIANLLHTRPVKLTQRERFELDYILYKR